MSAWVGFGFLLIVAGYFWYLQRKWEREHPGQRGWFFR